MPLSPDSLASRAVQCLVSITDPVQVMYATGNLLSETVRELEDNLQIMRNMHEHTG